MSVPAATSIPLLEDHSESTTRLEHYSTHQALANAIRDHHPAISPSRLDVWRQITNFAQTGTTSFVLEHATNSSLGLDGWGLRIADPASESAVGAFHLGGPFTGSRSYAEDSPPSDGAYCFSDPDSASQSAPDGQSQWGSDDFRNLTQSITRSSDTLPGYGAKMTREEAAKVAVQFAIFHPVLRQPNSRPILTKEDDSTIKGFNTFSDALTALGSATTLKQQPLTILPLLYDALVSRRRTSAQEPSLPAFGVSIYQEEVDSHILLLRSGLEQSAYTITPPPAKHSAAVFNYIGPPAGVHFERYWPEGFASAGSMLRMVDMMAPTVSVPVRLAQPSHNDTVKEEPGERQLTDRHTQADGGGSLADRVLSSSFGWVTSTFAKGNFE